MLPSNISNNIRLIAGYLTKQCGVFKTMPKIKTVRGAAKRFKKTASGGFKRKQSHLRHILTKKTTKRKRHLRHKSMVAKADQVLVVACLPYA